MLHYMLGNTLKKERVARDSLRFFAHWGAAIHRVGDTTEFLMLIPIRKPERRANLKKQLERNALGAQFLLVDVIGFDRDGPILKRVTESEANDLVASQDYVREAVKNEPDEFAAFA